MTGTSHPVRPERERLATPASLVTVVRTVAAVVCAGIAIEQQSLTWLIVSLAVYWVGDILDGALARLLDDETRIGAVLDICCDRLCAAVFYLGLAWLQPDLIWPILVYLFTFLVLDTVLSLAFLAWPCLSPNYFYEVDPTIWRYNWSRPAKAVNSAIFAVLLLVTGWVWLGLAIAAALLVLKSWSMRRLMRIGLPVPAGPTQAPVGDRSVLGAPAPRD
ncbi:MAG: CDP-alcohol phosphatidyltransferase family protein [Actinomycetia bacterium]|nr:CDP-alcohol phosphatidyltransferase family protein [Actinomycetes bacterium]